MNKVQEYARLLDDAARQAQAVARIDADGRLSLGDAYAIQAASVALRVARGERRVGLKMGFTSRAKMVQMGVSDVIWGRLTDAMRVEEGTAVRASSYVHARAEPELAFVLGKALPGGASASEALAAVEAVAPAIEIIDSRYRDFKFGLTDVIADNASSAGFVLGPWADPRRDLSNLGLALCIDGRPVQVGSTAAILGHPLRSLVAAARLAAAAGEPLQAGAVVMAGGATPAEALRPGQYVSVEMEGLGSAGFRIED